MKLTPEAYNLISRILEGERIRLVRDRAKLGTAIGKKRREKRIQNIEEALDEIGAIGTY